MTTVPHLKVNSKSVIAKPLVTQTLTQRQVSKAASCSAAGLHLGACVRKQHASNLWLPIPEMGMFIDKV